MPGKIASVSAAHLQGLEANLAHYERAVAAQLEQLNMFKKSSVACFSESCRGGKHGQAEATPTGSDCKHLLELGVKTTSSRRELL